MHVSGQFHIATSYPLNRRLIGSCILFGLFGEKINLLSPPGFETRIVQPVAGLHYLVSYRSLLLRQ